MENPSTISRITMTLFNDDHVPISTESVVKHFYNGLAGWFY